MSRSPHPVARRLLRAARFVVFLCTAGWVFPHVCTEDMDLRTTEDGRTAAKT